MSTSRRRPVLVGTILVLTVCTLILAAASVALFRSDPPDIAQGYVVRDPDADCVARLATTPRGPATLQVTLEDGKYGDCRDRADGRRIYYDPATMTETPGPGNQRFGAILLGFFALMCAAGTVHFLLTWLRARRAS